MSVLAGPYWDERLMIEDHNAPEVLALGDSWFWYPNNNLLIPLFNILGANRCVLAYGNNGAEAIELSGAKYGDTIESALDQWKGSISTVLISAGGNDFAGLDDMFKIVKPNCQGCTDVDECFIDGQPAGIFQEVADAYEKLIDMVGAAIPDCPIILHNYDRAIPTGVGFAGAGNWLREPMIRAGIADELQQHVVNRLLYEFTGRLAELAADNPERVWLVDSARLVPIGDPDEISGPGTLTAKQWANELHPTRAGFNKVARVWKPVFKAAGVI
jgi:hypothetical protein